MKKAVEASLIVSLSILGTALVLSLVLPNHPLATMTSANAPEAQLAVFIEGMDTRILPVSAQGVCPFVHQAAASSGCPYSRGLAASQACPFLAQRAGDVRCPAFGGQGSCPYSSGMMPGEAVPPLSCPRRDDRRPASPSGEDLRLAPPLMASINAMPENVPLSS